jgi:hypothetical protein
VIDLAALLLTCAPLVAQDTARALIQVESGGNPFAIGVVGGALARQPANLPEAVATVAALDAAGWNYSVGLGQINKRNFQRYGLRGCRRNDLRCQSGCEHTRFGQPDPCEWGPVGSVVVCHEAACALVPGVSAFDHPALGLHDEALGHDFGREYGAHQIRLEGGDCSTDSFCYASA